MGKPEGFDAEKSHDLEKMEDTIRKRGGSLAGLPHNLALYAPLERCKARIGQKKQEKKSEKNAPRKMSQR